GRSLSWLRQMREASKLDGAERLDISRQEADTTRESSLTAGALIGRLFNNTTSAITIVLLAICVVLSQLSPGFLTPRNVYAVLAQSAVVGVAAVGGTFVIITGGIDLSVGAAIGFSAMLGALSVQHGLTLQAAAGQSVYNLPPALTIFGGGRIFGGLPISVIVTVIVFVLGEIL